MRRLDESMTLLIEVMERPLDPGYAQEAHRQASAVVEVGVPGGTRGHRGLLHYLGVLFLAVALGAVTTVAAGQLRDSEPAARAARLSLEARILEHAQQIADASRLADGLDREIVEMEREALDATDPELIEAIRVDGLNNGAVAVHGPGMIVSLTNGGGGLADQNPDALVRDTDLQKVVQALWAAGAEAIAVDDQRLSTTTAIRNAGDAVLVDLVPLSGPTFVVRAIGDADAMHAAWARSGAPAYLQLLGAEFGIRSSAITQSDIELPGAGSKTLRFAKPVVSAP